MKTIAASIVLTLLAAIAHTAPAPAPVPQAEPCNPNAHGRQCFAVLYGAAGVSQSVSLEANNPPAPICKSSTLPTYNNPYPSFFTSKAPFLPPNTP